MHVKRCTGKFLLGVWLLTVVCILYICNNNATAWTYTDKKIFTQLLFMQSAQGTKCFSKNKNKTEEVYWLLALAFWYLSCCEGGWHKLDGLDSCVVDYQVYQLVVEGLKFRIRNTRVCCVRVSYNSRWGRYIYVTRSLHFPSILANFPLFPLLLALKHWLALSSPTPVLGRLPGPLAPAGG